MAWNPNIPQPGDALKDSQSQILQNFQALDALFNPGEPDFLMPVIPNAPATGANQIALYCKNGTQTGLPELFLRKSSNGAEIEFSSYKNGAANQPGTHGWTRLASGVLIKWGTVTTSLPMPNTITFPTVVTGVAAPAFVQCFQVIGSIRTNDSTVDQNIQLTIGASNALSFEVWTGPRTTIGSSAQQFSYRAIGV
jgi:hypothetical protein